MKPEKVRRTCRAKRKSYAHVIVRRVEDPSVNLAGLVKRKKEEK